MTSRYEAYMNGVALSSLDDAIYILDIIPEAVSPQYKSFRTAKTNGALIRDPYYEKSAVSITFEIHEYDIAERMEICQKVQQWAKAGILTTNDRDGQRLNAVCESFPMPNARDWTSPLTVTLAGYNPPFWEDITATTHELETEEYATLLVPGNAPETLVSATVTAGESISSMTFMVGEKTLVLSDLGLSANDVVELTYSNGFLSIKKGTTSLLNKVSSGSDDLLTAKCGEHNYFLFNASGDATCVYSYRGCWL